MRTLSRPDGPMAFLLGKPIRGESVFPEVFERLRRHGREVRVHLPHETGDFVPAWLADAALLVHRGLNPAALAALIDLEQAGLRCCNRIAATLAVNDRHGLQQRLETAGLPVPTGSLATTWTEALVRAQGRAVVVKAVDGRLGRGARVVVVEAAAGPPEAPFPGPYLVQDRVTHDGWDRKVYVAGPAYRGLLKPWPRRGSADRRPFAPEPMLGDLALAVGRVLGLEIYGVDFVVGGTGPLIVDVNVFPGFKGVPEAARLIVDHLIERDAASVRI